MNRFAIASCAALVAAAGSVHAAFLGIEVREDKTLDPADVAIADPGGVGLRVFNFYAKFDEEAVFDVQDPASQNTVISVGQPDAVSGLFIKTIDGQNQEAELYQNAGNGNLPPNSILIGLVPALGLDSYVGIGNKVNVNGTSDTTGTDPDFQMLPSGVLGGWFNSGGSNFQGAASGSNFNPEKGTYDVFLMQLSVLGLDENVSSGEGIALNGNAQTFWYNDIFTGSFTVFTQTPGGGATPHLIQFGNIPGPGPAVAVLMSATVAMPGRRRR